MHSFKNFYPKPQFASSKKRNSKIKSASLPKAKPPSLSNQNNKQPPNPIDLLQNTSLSFENIEIKDAINERINGGNEFKPSLTIESIINKDKELDARGSHNKSISNFLAENLSADILSQKMMNSNELIYSEDPKNSVFSLEKSSHVKLSIEKSLAIGSRKRITQNVQMPHKNAAKSFSEFGKELRFSLKKTEDTKKSFFKTQDGKEKKTFMVLK